LPYWRGIQLLCFDTRNRTCKIASALCTIPHYNNFVHLRDDRFHFHNKTIPGIYTNFISLITYRGKNKHRRIFRNGDRKSTRLNSSHVKISYAVFCLKKKKKTQTTKHV